MLVPCCFMASHLFLSVCPPGGGNNRVSKKHFHPQAGKEVSVLTAETLFPAFWSRSSDGALHRTALPCLVFQQALLAGRCTPAEVEVRNDTELPFVSVRFPGTSILGHRVLDTADQHKRLGDQVLGSGDWKPEIGGSCWPPC